MLERTDHAAGPWEVIEGDDKRFARVKVIETVCDRMEAAMVERGTMPKPNDWRRTKE